MPSIALHPTLAKQIRALTDAQRAAVSKAFQKLALNRFDGGLRVKKMRAQPRVAVWEARVDGAGRLLFTFGKHRYRQTGAATVTAHCWTLLPDHDDVSRTLRRGNYHLDPDQEWLAEDELAGKDWMGALPENPGATLDTIEADFPGEAPWEALASLSDAYEAAWTAPPAALPWYVTHAEAFASWAAGHDLPAELLLSDEQVEILQMPLPLFLNGPAGSGKTTLALYKLLALQEREPALRTAFVAHNPRLVAQAQEQYERLSHATGGGFVAFLTYDSLLRALTGGIQAPALSSAHEIGRFLALHPMSQAERALIATDIRSVLKGMLPPGLTPTKPEEVTDLLPEDVYQTLPEHWTSRPPEHRAAAYRLAQAYQAHLAERDQLDDQDLATRALRALLRGVPRSYDVLVLDEVQDLTDKQLRVVLRVPRAKGGQGLLLAGDPTQTLLDSGFSWRLPRSVFNERGWPVPKPITLTRSYRSGAPTLRLAQAIARLLQDFGGEVVPLDPEQARAEGPIPVCVQHSDAIDALLHEGRPDVIVLVENADRAVALRQAWGHPFIWSVEEAKGLEAEHVLLYELPARLRDLPGAGQANRERAARETRHILRLHYVAVTRARESVTVIHGANETPSLWARDEVSPLVLHNKRFTPIWRGAPSSEDWVARGQYYRDHGQWEAAAVCMERGQEGVWASALRAIDQYGDAPVDVVTALKDAATTADVPAACANFLLDQLTFRRPSERQAHVWLLEAAGLEDERAALQARIDEDAGAFEAAAQYYEARGDLQRARSVRARGEVKEKVRRPKDLTQQASPARKAASVATRPPGRTRKAFAADTPLITAVRRDDVQEALRLLTTGVPVDERGQANMTALHVAAWQRHEPMMKLLIEWGADPNALDDQMETPLHALVAVTGNKPAELTRRPLLPAARLLLAAGARPDAYSIVCRTPAQWVEDKEIRQVIEAAEVAYYQAHPNAPSVEDAWPSLGVMERGIFAMSGAIQKRAGSHLPCAAARALIGQTARRGSHQGDSTLFTASQRGDTVSLHNLLAGGAQVNESDEYGITPLHHAARHRHLAAVEVLLGAGANPNALDLHMETPLYAAVVVGEAHGMDEARTRPLIPVLEALLNAGARPDAHSVFFQTPARAAREEAVQSFLRQAEVTFHVNHPDAPAVKETWPPDLTIDPRIRELGEMNARALLHLPCDEALSALYPDLFDSQ